MQTTLLRMCYIAEYLLTCFIIGYACILAFCDTKTDVRYEVKVFVSFSVNGLHASATNV